MEDMMVNEILLVLFICSGIMLLAYMSAFFMVHKKKLNNYFKSRKKPEEEEESIPQYKTLSKTLVPNMGGGKSYRISSIPYSGTFICNHVYMCEEDFYPNGMELHITVLKPEGVYETYLTFGKKLTFNVHRSLKLEPIEISKEDKRLLKVIRG